MRIINRYIIVNFLSSFSTYLTIVAFLILVNYVYQILNSLLIHKPNIDTILNLLFYLVPSVLSLTVPITFLLSIILSFSSLNEQKELQIISTMGIPSFSYTKIVVFISLVIVGILIYFNGYIVPTTYKNFKYIYFKKIISKPSLNITNNGTITLENKKIFTYKVNNNKIEKLYITNYLDKNTFQTIYAKESFLFTNKNGDIVISMKNGKITIIDFNKPDSFFNINFDKYTYIIYKSEINKIIPYNKTFREMDNKELLQEFYSSSLEKYKKLVLSEYFLRFTLSFSSLFFTILGIILGMKIKKNSKAISFLASILVILLYYFLLSLSLTIIERVDTIPLSFFHICSVMQLPNIGILIICFFISIITKLFIKL
ncbi:MAG: LptF/LptG family permease [Endomicrobia bacterium]|nr:LptF/LptG family permease [Endomicrobiia bacterium]